MSLPVTVVALNLGDIFHFFLDGAGVNTCCKRDVAITTFLAPLAPRIFLLVVLVFFASLVLVTRRLLMLTTRFVNKKNVSRLSIFGVILLFFVGPVLLETPGIYLAGT